MMFCSACGAEVASTRNFCNRCGANLKSSAGVAEEPAQPPSIVGPMWAITVMVVAGLGIVFSTVRELARSGVAPMAITWIVLGSVAMIFGVIALFFRYLSGTKRTTRKSEAALEERPRELPPMPVEAYSSVTEHTTRTFEPTKTKS